MAYTTQLRSFLADIAEKGVEIPDQITGLLNTYDAIGNSALDLILSADAEGCSEDLTVVNATKLDNLSEVLSVVRDNSPQVQPVKFSVVGIYPESGQIVCHHVLAPNGARAFDFVDDDELKMVVSIAGHHFDGASLTFPDQER